MGDQLSGKTERAWGVIPRSRTEDGYKWMGGMSCASAVGRICICQRLVLVTVYCQKANDYFHSVDAVICLSKNRQYPRETVS